MNVDRSVLTDLEVARSFHVYSKERTHALSRGGRRGTLADLDFRSNSPTDSHMDVLKQQMLCMNFFMSNEPIAHPHPNLSSIANWIPFNANCTSSSSNGRDNYVRNFNTAFIARIANLKEFED